MCFPQRGGSSGASANLADLYTLGREFVIGMAKRRSVRVTVNFKEIRKGQGTLDYVGGGWCKRQPGRRRVVWAGSSVLRPPFPRRLHEGPILCPSAALACAYYVPSNVVKVWLRLETGVCTLEGTSELVQRGVCRGRRRRTRCLSVGRHVPKCFEQSSHGWVG